MPSTRINGGTVEIMMNDLLNAGIKTASVYFDGCGDSGSIESVSYYNEFNALLNDSSVLNNNALTDAKYPYESRTSAYNSETKRWDETWELETVSANKLIEVIAYEKLEESNIDWYNNDGGFGEVNFFFDSKRIELDMNQRYTEINSHNFSWRYNGLAALEGDE